MAILARISIGLIFALFIVGSVATPLDDYVNAPDPTYNWKLVNQFRGQDFTAYNIYLTSQTWRSTKEVSIAVWTHWFQICVPDNVRKFCRIVVAASCLFRSLFCQNCQTMVDNLPIQSISRRKELVPLLGRENGRGTVSCTFPTFQSSVSITHQSPCPCVPSIARCKSQDCIDLRSRRLQQG